MIHRHDSSYKQSLSAVLDSALTAVCALNRLKDIKLTPLGARDEHEAQECETHSSVEIF